MANKPKYPGIRLTTNGNQLVAYYTEARLCEAGIFYPITPSTEMGENFHLSFANGELNVFGDAKIAIEAEGEHSAQQPGMFSSFQCAMPDIRGRGPPVFKMHGFSYKRAGWLQAF